MKHILVAFGTRPEIIKLAPVIRALENTSKVSVLHSGQHRELADPLLSLFDIQPDENLAIMKPGQDLFDLTANLMPKLKDVLSKKAPDYVIVQGDTTTSYLTALAAFYLKIPVLHVEAGLRSHDLYNPFPEEMNRKQISVIASHHFAPTKLSQQNLLKEGVPEASVSITGNTVIDALHMIRKMQDFTSHKPELLSDINPEETLILLTAHRRENHGTPLVNIFKAVESILKKHTHAKVVFPAHPNPNVKKAVDASGISNDRFLMVEPLDYLPFLHLIERADLILTDSGGIQEEAAALGKPVLVLRNETERQELIDAGLGKLVGSDTAKIIEETGKLLTSPSEIKATDVFGDGQAARRIADFIQQL
ncbi:non-hydrolyzing UDP-N-acetylglucosamine 2-epimerase [Gracilimonas mengyeensis]|uniref:UDP-N-acetylglucosamine 2-epimerase (non-hydrolyzing) n=1 Tax=Gracilimonas mengyeensis TaxID=1302730 RepID=A0A521AGL0_9BACT|nr:UDP-N-acetylglucosamine 2-epimerase (non-hydrolyzing) [Gracilimonas mengyeensis]SMO33913.1 UDP-N-Acetylglucosamine 2-epimerase [Gracilimonas mengyeensis]